MTVGLTFDSGALRGLERPGHAMRKVFATAIARRVPIVVPVVVIAAWWRRGAREEERSAILRAVRVEPLSAQLARLAGIAVGLVPGAQTLDAIVVASASLRGDVVYTSNPGALDAICRHTPGFGGVRILPVAGDP
jgi:hypothetical protein